MELKGHTIGFKGEYSATVLKADGTVKEFLNEEKTLRSGDVIKNLLLDNFFQRLISVENPISNSCLRVGTGSNPVAVNQTALANQISISGNWPVSTLTGTPAILEGGLLKASVSGTFTFTLGQVVGNISELGIDFSNLSSTSQTIIHSRALVVDGSGNPTTITVTAQEQLVITYTLKMETSASDVITNYPLNVSGTTVNTEITHRWAGPNPLTAFVTSGILAANGLDVFDGALTPYGSSLTGNRASSGGPSIAYNVSGGKTDTYSFSISQGNLAAGISSAGRQSNQGLYKLGFNPPIPKNSDRTLSITILRTFGRLP